MAKAPRWCVALALLPGWSALLAQSALQITSPADGTVVNPGHVIGVTVSDPGEPLKNVAIVGWNPIGISRILQAPPYQFDMEIPMEITPGKYLLTAVGTSKSGPVDSQPVSIDVERPDLPDTISTDFKQLGMNVGDKLPISVVGTYADGSDIDLNKSSQTTFRSQSPAIATVTSEGVVTALSPGSTQIVIDGRISVPVTVEPLIRMQPGSATLKASQTREFVAIVTQPPNGRVNWTLSPNVGSVVDGRYTAPDAVDTQQAVAITATSVDNPALTSTALIKLSPEASIEIAPTWALLYREQTRKFNATATDAGTQGVRWSVSPKAAGTITADGLYTAPATIFALQKVTITATSAAKPAITGSTDIYISPRPFKMLMFHSALTLATNGTAQTTVLVLATDRFLHPIALSVAEVPIGIRTEFSNATLTGNNSTTLTFTYENRTTPGAYKIEVMAQDTVYPVLKDVQTLTLNVTGGAQ